MKIEMLLVEDLKPYSKNSRKHSDSQIEKVAASIKEFGFTNPILIDAENTVTAGHCRLRAAMLLGIKKVPTIRLSHLNANQVRAYVIADNKLALESEWDEAILASEMSELRELDFNIELTGFDSSFFSAPFIPDLPDDNPKPSKESGDIFLRVTFEDQDAQQELFIELRDRGFKVKV